LPSSRRRAPLGFLVLLLAAAAPLAATTIVPVRDAVLVDQALLVVVATAGGTLPVPGERPATEYLMTVERVLKGTVDASVVTVRVPGGRAADGSELRLYGAPRFRKGERAMLFLSPRADGTYGILHFLQGAFHRARVGGRDVAYRDESEVRVLPGGDGDASRAARHFDRFADWIEDRARGEIRERDYMVRLRPSQMQALVEQFTLFEVDGLNLRWFTFDNGGSVAWLAHQGGQTGLTGGGFAEFQRALQAWNNESGTPIRLTYGGTTSESAGFDHFDNKNVLLFDDPNQDIEGTFDCSEGGTLAVGGPWSDSSSTGNFNGRRYVRIQAADIVINDGVSCRFSRSPNASKMMEEIYAHELGHGLGMGHSSEDASETNFTLRDALLYFRVHDDGRGARLASDDIAGIRSLYQRAGGGGGGGGTPGCPDGSLCLVNGRFQVRVTWQNQFNGAAGSGGPIRDTDLAGFFYFDDPSNVELIVKILDFGTEIKVFYSQLTNLHFTMTVLDTRTGTTKNYSNTAGECGAIENSAFPAALEAPGMDPLTDAATDGLGATTAAVTGTCVQDADTLCLLDRRFAIDVNWRNQFDGSSGVGRQRRLSELTGAFSFGDPANVELLVKTLQFPTSVLVIYGSLSNFEYTIRITDTLTGQTKTYSNPAGRFCGGIDTTAFPAL
jgi:hypothetical protein